MGKKIVINLYALAEKRNMSMRKLSRISNIRVATIHELANMKRQNINYNHIIKIAESANISDIREIIDLVDTKD